VLRDRLLQRLAWEAGRARLRAGVGRTAFTPPPSGPAAALHVTTVSRLPAEVVVALAPALDRLGLDLDGDARAARLAELARQRRRDFGSWTVTELELVRTDRYLSHEGTAVLARLGLGPTGTGPARGPS
jgi:hypothetical protein